MHAQALLFKATVLAQKMKKYRWAVKVYRKAAIIIDEIEEARFNKDGLLNQVVMECEKVVQATQQESGEELDIDELSEEEDADCFKDNQQKLNVMSVASPLMFNSQQCLQLLVSQRGHLNSAAAASSSRSTEETKKK